MTTKCIICGIEGKHGLRLMGLQNDPFFCERCLFLIFMKDKPFKLASYRESMKSYDDTVSMFAPENIWKEDV